MDNLVGGYQNSGSINVFGFDHILIPGFSDQNLISDHHHHQFDLLSNDPNPSNLSPSSWTSSEENVSDAVLRYINQMLMEDDDWEDRPSLLQDSSALRAAEKSFYDVLGEKYPPSPNLNRSLICENVESPDDDFTRTCSSSHSSNSSGSVNNIIDSDSICDRNKFGCSLVQPSRVDHNFGYVVQSNSKTFGSSNGFCDAVVGTVDSLVSSFEVLDPSKEGQAISELRGGKGKLTRILPKEDYENYDLELKAEMKNWREHSRGKKSHYREDTDYLEAGRSIKQLASYDGDSDNQPEMYDEVLLSPALNPHLHKEESSACLPDESPRNGAGEKLQKNGQAKGSSGRKPRGKKQGYRKKVVDLATLLTHCAQAVASNDCRTATDLLKQIRQHSSLHGDGTERMAHFFATALEARLAGSGQALDASPAINRLSATDTLKAYLAYLTACPFQKMSNFFANKLIWNLAAQAKRLHIIDFGIIHGFQWPRLLQDLSLRPGGPPRVRITGIDFPQPGFRPAERVDETGHRLTYYCQRFNVPFEYNGVAKKWDTIQLEDLNIQRDEVLVVNCLGRLRYVPDVTEGMNSPRDAVLNLIKRTNPDLFIHGVVNGTYNAPIFVTRFREVMFQAYAAFDMFDAILPREDQGRMLYEREVLGRGAISVIACEGTERVIRPETYKQWQIRNTRAGLSQLPLDRGIVKDARAKVKLGYHKEFMVDEDSNWLLQGWKGRILGALSCWKPPQILKNMEQSSQLLLQE